MRLLVWGLAWAGAICFSGLSLGGLAIVWSQRKRQQVGWNGTDSSTLVGCLMIAALCWWGLWVLREW